ncbi:MAG TPA: 2-C-methyl-D-erythritol 4-phosphate cytidylyltransferase [Bacteroidia bacterium]|nr:2-C-methyl-D-erythritol 4-phosphate cytidylyltransferase [Bacteroidia bacterium]
MLIRYCIVVAGGSGSRMKSDIPKQFLEIGKKPVLLLTLEHIRAYDPDVRIILVLPDDQKDRWEKIKGNIHFSHPIQTVSGGLTRFQSVKNGLQLVPENCLVAIHDAVRPFASPSLFARCFEEAEKFGNAIPTWQVFESLRRISNNSSTQVDRSEYLLVQTPQCFQSSLLKKAFLQTEDPSFTDDASVLEKSGETIHLTTGEKWNIKITHPEDMLIAPGLLSLDTTRVTK